MDTLNSTKQHLIECPNDNLQLKAEDATRAKALVV